MSNKKRRYKGKRPPSDLRDTNLRSVSTNVEKKETVPNKIVSQDVKSENDTGFSGIRKNKRRPMNNRDNFKDKTNERQGEPKHSVSINAKNIYTEATRVELKRGFLKSEQLKLFTSKVKKSIKSNLDRKKLSPYLTQSHASEVCSICNKNITNMATVIFDEENENYSHFDCVYDKVKERCTLGENERIVYVGNGAFAVLEDYKEAGVYKFRIKQKIQMVSPSSVK
ncbi:MAG: hypothetical protein A2015_00330 [Spirochaetes bacterium GWF1_31_7]|nr:MAG: hypothetical protein A2Y30_04180 [Spirochaetes bacterium GWE1_32_154]OHD51035.1 MAG: hypothetical protein A2015_00330 [Spirochaetes bacterium GWF1_31_7]OHD51785.1 MAG: hypothetical protein A2Y29_09130 [Spirochaetes bacterium GWE2_31_10]OHD77716.1 MAG: hypothetical protein A2355_03130 [Spirochaetes bacterium RIFOXYB1_FULL_32_8]HBD94352.1 hypothetical protein [Spirochaetia bacterium]